jgi:hypothetical protein
MYQSISKYFDFFSVNKPIKKNFKYIFPYSFTSSIQSCKNNQEKKFAQILHFLHLIFGITSNRNKLETFCFHQSKEEINLHRTF